MQLVLVGVGQEMGPPVLDRPQPGRLAPVIEVDSHRSSRLRRPGRRRPSSVTTGRPADSQASMPPAQVADVVALGTSRAAGHRARAPADPAHADDGAVDGHLADARGHLLPWADGVAGGAWPACHSSSSRTSSNMRAGLDQQAAASVGSTSGTAGGDSEGHGVTVHAFTVVAGGPSVTIGQLKADFMSSMRTPSGSVQ